jgi:DNA-binding Lrp family transcriptional regulator
MARVLEDQDARLLNALQEQLPLVDRPFAAIGEKLHMSEAEVLTRVTTLKTPPDRVIRQISAIFDTKSLGYQSTLVAAKVEESRLDAAVQAINAHPGVTHNYLRNHAYNLWYTVATPPDSRLGLEKTVQLLHHESGALATRMFPTLKLYKIGVSFDLSGESLATARSQTQGFGQADRAKALSFTVTDADKRMIRVLQQDLPIVQRPFEPWAKEASVTQDQLLAAAQRYLDQKQMRRFSAVLHHRAAGFSANGMGAWAVPPDQQDSFGATAATFSAVSHCYLRPTYEDWPYSIFTMVHGTSEAACHAVLQAISTATGLRDYTALFSSKEFKKTRLRYFLGDIEAWESTRI